jgi:hypothetical protein
MPAADLSRQPRFDRLGAALGAPLLFFVLLPLTVYALNPGSVDVPKAVLLACGVALCLSALVLWPLTRVPAAGAFVVAALESAAAALFVLILFSNRTGEIAGLGDDLALVTNVAPTLKLVVLLVAALVWRKLRPAPFRATLQAMLLAALVASSAIVSTSAHDAARRTAVVQGSDGKFAVRGFERGAKGLAAALTAPPSTDVFAVALNLGRGELPARLRAMLPARAPKSGISCFYVASQRSRPSAVVHCAAGELAAQANWLGR